jgi:hypothetical protein
MPPTSTVEELQKEVCGRTKPRLKLRHVLRAAVREWVNPHHRGLRASKVIAGFRVGAR